MSNVFLLRWEIVAFWLATKVVWLSTVLSVWTMWSMWRAQATILQPASLRRFCATNRSRAQCKQALCKRVNCYWKLDSENFIIINIRLLLLLFLILFLFRSDCLFVVLYLITSTTLASKNNCQDREQLSCRQTTQSHALHLEWAEQTKQLFCQFPLAFQRIFIFGPWPFS